MPASQPCCCPNTAGMDRGEGARTFLAVSLRLRLGKLRLLLGRSFLLVAFLPLCGRHSIDDLPRLILLQDNALFGGGFPVPVAKAVATESREIHHVDVLHVGALPEMRDQAPKSRRL